MTRDCSDDPLLVVPIAPEEVGEVRGLGRGLWVGVLGMVLVEAVNDGAWWPLFGALVLTTLLGLAWPHMTKPSPGGPF